MKKLFNNAIYVMMVLVMVGLLYSANRMDCKTMVDREVNQQTIYNRIDELSSDDRYEMIYWSADHGAAMVLEKETGCYITYSITDWGVGTKVTTKYKELATDVFMQLIEEV